MKKCILLSALIIAISFTSCSKAPASGFTQSDLEFEYAGMVFNLNEDSSNIIKELGNEYVFSEAPSCVYEGTDKTFEYAGIEVYTYPLNGKDNIDEIVLTDSTYPTRKKIYVGDTIEKVKQAYGDNYTDDGYVLKYSLKPDSLKSPALFFVYDKAGIVTSINYYSASNIEKY